MLAPISRNCSITGAFGSQILSKAAISSAVSSCGTSCIGTPVPRKFSISAGSSPARLLIYSVRTVSTAAVISSRSASGRVIQ